MEKRSNAPSAAHNHLDEEMIEEESVPAVKIRNCMVCREAFPSAWAGERICRRCKSTKGWREGM